MASLKGKVVIITGASSGIGCQTAIEFAKLGSKLVICGRNMENLRKTFDSCIAEGLKESEVLMVQAEMGKDEDLKKIIDECVAKFGQIDVLINNAGLLRYNSVESISMDEYDELFRVNTRAVVYLSHLATPYLTKVKGNIVVVSSVSALRSFAGILGYCMSKAAVDQFVRCSAIELASKQVRVNSVNPGVVETEIHKRSGMDEATYRNYLVHCKTTHPLGRPGELEEVSKTITFLASDTASFITGASIPIDGGRHSLLLTAHHPQLPGFSSGKLAFTVQLSLKIMASLKGKVVVITGASSGIGCQTAIEFAKLGSKLVICGRNMENLKKTFDSCIAEGLKESEVLMVQAEMGKDEDLKEIINECVAKFSQIDVLVNNAGLLHKGSIENLSMDEYDEQFRVNTRAVVYLSHLATPYLTKVKGNIVVVSSVNGIRSFPNVLGYCMSKAAVDQFVRCSAIELASKQVRVNSVNPGVVKTEIHKRGGMDEEAYKNFLEHCKTTHALGRPGEVEEVAKTITFLASDAASFITGASIPIDGGRHALCPR
ncbi:uncharacterized protein LOC141901149 [Tubulanus polymorphus]|uniref:uncharacterized protein LOC141901149 n=1 Tax=Tubulanus polymorphus TaxID=672921 RepID=UPI003DA55421